MPNITRTNIADRIGDILDGISSSVFPVKYRYLESNPSSYPALMLKYGGATSEMLDTVTDLVTAAPWLLRNTARYRTCPEAVIVARNWREDDVALGMFTQDRPPSTDRCH